MQARPLDLRPPVSPLVHAPACLGGWLLHSPIFSTRNRRRALIRTPSWPSPSVFRGLPISPTRNLHVCAVDGPVTDVVRQERACTSELPTCPCARVQVPCDTVVRGQCRFRKTRRERRVARAYDNTDRLRRAFEVARVERRMQSEIRCRCEQ